MTLSENVHKFAELSQRIVVERSVIQTYEETKDNTKTTEISVENFNRTVLSTSTHDELKSDADIVRIPEATTVLSTTNESNGDIRHSEENTLVKMIKFDRNDGDDDDQVEVKVEQVNSIGDPAYMVTNCSATKSTMSVIKSSVTTTTNGGVTSCSSSNTVECALIDNNKPNKGSEALINNGKVSEVTVQRPLKPQSEMDFLVPYNIINNYFSVGVVRMHNLFHQHVLTENTSVNRNWNEGHPKPL